jgi:hypothetical protein
MLVYIPLLQWLPEDGTSMSKHVGVDVCHKWCITRRMVGWYIDYETPSHSKQINTPGTEQAM